MPTPRAAKAWHPALRPGTLSYQWSIFWLIVLQTCARYNRGRFFHARCAGKQQIERAHGDRGACNLGGTLSPLHFN